MDSKLLTVTIDRGLATVPEALERFAPSLARANGSLVFQYKPSVTTVGELLNALQEAHLGVVDLSTEEADLEDIFLRLTAIRIPAPNEEDGLAAVMLALLLSACTHRP